MWNSIRFSTSARRPAISPSLRILAAVLWIFAIALTPNGAWRWQAVSIFALLILSPIVQLPWKTLIVRLGVLVPFLLLISLGLLWQPDAALRVGNVLLKASLSLWIMIILMHITSQTEFVTGLRRLHTPRIWVELIGFLLRYLVVLTEEWNRMQLARRSRTFNLTRQDRVRLLAQALGLLFIRAYERAERVHQAMLARGYQSR